MIETFEGHTPKIAASAYVHASAVVIGDVEIGEDASVWPTVVIRGDVNYVRIGPRTSVQDGTVIHVAHAGPYNPTGHPTLVGADVTIGHKAVVHACTIGDRVLVGMGAVIMDGAEVGDDAIIGANALVPPGKKLEGGYLYVGSPVKQARALTAEEKEKLEYSAAHYVRLKNRHSGD